MPFNIRLWIMGFELLWWLDNKSTWLLFKTWNDKLCQPYFAWGNGTICRIRYSIQRQIVKRGYNVYGQRLED